MFEITVLELEEWAKKYTAKFEFPNLIRSLIWATCSNIRQLDMPGEELVYLSGFDGIVQCDGGNNLVPPGLSVWELGTDKNVTSKANDDYEKRTKDSGTIAKEDASFIFATPCRWPTHGNWEAEKNMEGLWKQVHGYCSHHLQRWINSVPWIMVAFTRRALCKHIAGFRTLEMIWNDYADVPYPDGNQLSPNFIITGREHVCDEFKKWLLKEDILPKDRIIRFSGPSEREVLDFIAATIHSLKEVNRTKFEKRIFVVDDIGSAQCLRGVCADHTILATGDVVPYAIRQWRQTGCRVIIFHSCDHKDNIQPLPGIQCLELHPPPKNSMIQVVIQIGYSPEQAIAICETNSFDYEQIRKTIFLY